jgi:hypothetical protein
LPFSIANPLERWADRDQMDVESLVDAHPDDGPMGKPSWVTPGERGRRGTEIPSGTTRVDNGDTVGWFHP